MIPSNSTRALAVALPSTSGLMRPRIGILALLVALPAAAARAQVGEAPPRPVFADNAPVIPHEDLARVALPNTTIDSVELNAADGSCRVRATVTHPPTGCRVKVYVALPTKGWNGRFLGTGGGGYMGGNPKGLSGPVRSGYATAATDTGHEGGSGSFQLPFGNDCRDPRNVGPGFDRRDTAHGRVVGVCTRSWPLLPTPGPRVPSGGPRPRGLRSPSPRAS